MKRTSTIERNAQTSLHLRKGFRIMKISSHERTLRNFNKTLLLLTALIAVPAFIACDGGEEVGDGNTINGSTLGSQSASSYYVEDVGYPTNAEDFKDANLLYGNRDFLCEYQGIPHLGRDLIYAAGYEIHPIANGKIVFYGKASGYGTLVTVIEHVLEVPITVTNGDGESVSIHKFLTIYGHGSKTDPTGQKPALTWKVGDAVTTSDVIQYVQTDALNGDGTEHLHLGVRIQSLADAQATEPKYWFRGDDNINGDFKKYYTKPGTFLPALAAHIGVSLEHGAAVATITHHPIGTLLYDEESGKDWLVVEDDQILDVSSYQTLPRACRIKASSEELACYRIAAFHAISTVLDATVIKFDGSPEVYRLFPGGGFDATGYQVFLSYESFLSWGYKDSDLLNYPASEKQELISALENKGGVGFMPGALAKGFGESETSVANQHGTRRPIFNWELFQDLGYTSNCVYEIEPSTLDVVAGAKSSDLITDSTIQECPTGTSQSICTPGSVLPCSCGTTSGTQSCLDDGLSFGPCMCEPGQGGGTGEHCNPPGATLPCDDICEGGTQECLADNTLGACICPPTGTGGSAGASGSGGSSSTGGTAGTAGAAGSGGAPQADCVSGTTRDCSSLCGDGYIGNEPCESGFWSGTCACYPDSSGTGGTSGTGGSANTGGTSGTGGSAGTGGSSGTGGTSQSSDYVSINLRYQGPSWTMPTFTYAVGSGDWGSVPGCTATASQTAECTFSLPVASLSSFRWQVSLGNNRYWGDTSGLAPAPCIPASELPNYYGTSVTVIGTVWLEFNGVPTEFGLCSNGMMNNNYSNICGESLFPWMNGCLYP